MVPVPSDGTRAREQLKATIKLKWLCSLLVPFHAGAALAVSCPDLCWNISSWSRRAIMSSSRIQTAFWGHRVRICVFLPSLIADNDGRVILNHLIFTAGMSKSRRLRVGESPAGGAIAGSLAALCVNASKSVTDHCRSEGNSKAKVNGKWRKG